MDPHRLQKAKWQARELFSQRNARARAAFRAFAVRKYRCKPAQVTFDTPGALRRISRAFLIDEVPGYLGQTDGKSIEIMRTAMTHGLLVNTLIHEALHDWCRVRGKFMSCANEHHCMRVLGG